MKTNWFLTALPIVLSLVLACSQEPTEQRAVSSELQASTAESVDSVWNSHEVVIQAALEGGPIFEDRYMEACKFFEELTGIPIRGEGTFVGWLPDEHTAEDLQANREWYSMNRNRLYWDEVTKSVKVRD